MAVKNFLIGGVIGFTTGIVLYPFHPPFWMVLVQIVVECVSLRPQPCN